MVSVHCLWSSSTNDGLCARASNSEGPVAAPARACFDCCQYEDMSTTMCDLNVETSVGFAAEVSLEVPLPDDKEIRKVLLRLLGLQNPWAQVGYEFIWRRLWEDVPPSD